MAVCVAASRDGYFARSASISPCIVSAVYCPDCVTSKLEASLSDSKPFSELAPSFSFKCADALHLLKWPPCMGGVKLIQGSSTRATRYRCMLFMLSAECDLYVHYAWSAGCSSDSVSVAFRGIRCSAVRPGIGRV